MLKKLFVFSLFICLLIGGLSYLVFFTDFLTKNQLTSSRLQTPQASPWMMRQIQQDFACFRSLEPISKRKIIELADQNQNVDFLVRYEIKNNKARMIKNFSTLNERAHSLLAAFQNMCRHYSIPDIDFIVSLHDATSKPLGVPLFVMAKNIRNQEQILIPDFNSVQGKYQILKNRDITKSISPSWEMKKEQLVWRGNSSQTPNKKLPTVLGDSKCFSRVMLCELSEQFPTHIDAKITRFVDGWEKLHGLEHLRGDFMSYQEQLNYKYQMLIDGYTCSYSNSGWKWFSNSLVFKEDSENIQWYYSGLKPYEHFIPVKEGLEDLMEKITWAQSHDAQAKEIALRAREFAIDNITQEKDLVYLYHVFLAYSALDFVD